ncbi:MAG: hypothetical protein KDC13_04175 [Bacteroidetes bacterium]|nr:hypothetical protein [Bacteroidota bacterium]
MKALLVLPLALLLSTAASASVSGSFSDFGKKDKNQFLNKIFRPGIEKHFGFGPQSAGHAVLLINVDGNGKPEILESSVSSDEMETYINDKLKDYDFRTMENQTIRLVIDYRK